jgi:hypothetical protein
MPVVLEGQHGNRNTVNGRTVDANFDCHLSIQHVYSVGNWVSCPNPGRPSIFQNGAQVTFAKLGNIHVPFPTVYSNNCVVASLIKDNRLIDVTVRSPERNIRCVCFMIIYSNA